MEPQGERDHQTNDGPIGVGTTYESSVKDAGLKSKRSFRLTEFDPPNRIRYTELSKNLVTLPVGGYNLGPDGNGTQLTVRNELEGQGFGRLLVPLALRAARKDAEAFTRRIKRAVEAS